MKQEPINKKEHSQQDRIKTNPNKSEFELQANHQTPKTGVELDDLGNAGDQSAKGQTPAKDNKFKPQLNDEPVASPPFRNKPNSLDDHDSIEVNKKT